MKIRTATVAAGIAACLLVAATPPEGHVASSETIYNAISCVRAEDGTTCASTAYGLSTAPGDSTVGTLPGPTTPYNAAVYYVDGVYSYQAFSPAAGVAKETFLVDASQPLVGQVTLSGYRELPDASLDAGVSVQLILRTVDEATGKATSRVLETEVTKQVMAPGDNVFEYEFDVPDVFDHAETSVTSMKIGIRGVHVLTNGFMDGQGGSFFQLPVFEEAGATA